MNLKWLLFSFKGRLNRKPFWLLTLCGAVIWIALSLLLGIDIMHRSKSVKSLIPAAILLWPSLAVQSKRWHDRDKSAWWILINMVPIAGPLWSLIENGFMPGTDGENRFGENPLRGLSEEHVHDDNRQTLSQQTPTKIDTTPQKYYLSTLMKAALIFGGVMIMFLSLTALRIGRQSSIGALGPILFTVENIIILSVLIWRMATPLVEISPTGIKISIPFIFKTNAAKWEEIDAMIIGEIRTLGIKEKNIKLLLKSEKGSTKEIFFSLKAVEKPDEIIQNLRAKIPEKGYEEIRKAAVLQRPFTKSSIKYRGWFLTQTGLTKGKETIAWNSVKELKYAGLVVAGYGATTISYTSYAGNNVRTKSIAVQPKSSEEYLDFIRYLVQHSSTASIDPGLLKAMEYPVKDARADAISIFLFLSGLIFFFIVLTIMIYYSPTITSSNLYPLVAFPFFLVPLVMSIKTLVGRFRGKAEISSRKLLWPALLNGGLLFSLLIYFVLSPYSFYWLAGDVSRKLNNLDQTEHYYKAALESVPDGIDVLYELGTVYMEKKEYEQAYQQLKKAYEKDPKYWGPDAVVRIPESLMKVGRYDEAADWCRRILKDNSGDAEIAGVINRKLAEINAVKEAHNVVKSNQ